VTEGPLHFKGEQNDHRVVGAKAHTIYLKRLLEKLRKSIKRLEERPFLKELFLDQEEGIPIH